MDRAVQLNLPLLFIYLLFIITILSQGVIEKKENFSRKPYSVALIMSLLQIWYMW